MNEIGSGHFSDTAPETGEILQTAKKPHQAPVYAAIDLGTNNCRLVIARQTYDGVRVVDAFSRIVHLGRGLRKTGDLTPAAMERSVETLKICADKIRAHGVTMCRAVATEACRKARNHADFLSLIHKETGLEIEIISGEEEASLAVAGCLPLVDPLATRALIFDIGGGSTELAWVNLDDPSDPRILDRISVPDGVVTLTERFGGDRIDRQAYEAMGEHMRQQFLPLEQRQRISTLFDRENVQIIGASGTVTTIAAVNFGLPRYQRGRVDGTWLSTTDSRRIATELRRQTSLERAQDPCIGPARADMIVSGCAILEAMYRIWPIAQLRVADRGVREGLLWQMITAWQREQEYQDAAE